MDSVTLAVRPGILRLIRREQEHLENNRVLSGAPSEDVCETGLDDRRGDPAPVLLERAEHRLAQRP